MATIGALSVLFCLLSKAKTPSLESSTGAHKTDGARVRVSKQVRAVDDCMTSQTNDMIIVTEAVIFSAM